jgi:hypothetical protein
MNIITMDMIKINRHYMAVLNISQPIGRSAVELCQVLLDSPPTPISPYGIRNLVDMINIT